MPCAKATTRIYVKMVALCEYLHTQKYPHSQYTIHQIFLTNSWWEHRHLQLRNCNSTKIFFSEFYFSNVNVFIISYSDLNLNEKLLRKSVIFFLNCAKIFQCERNLYFGCHFETVKVIFNFVFFCFRPIAVLKFINDLSFTENYLVFRRGVNMHQQEWKRPYTLTCYNLAQLQMLFFPNALCSHCMNATASAQSPKFLRNIYPQMIFANFCR